MIYQYPTQYKSIKNFREQINEKEFSEGENAEVFKSAPLMLLNPTRRLEDER